MYDSPLCLEQLALDQCCSAVPSLHNKTLPECLADQLFSQLQLQGVFGVELQTIFESSRLRNVTVHSPGALSTLRHHRIRQLRVKQLRQERLHVADLIQSLQSWSRDHLELLDLTSCSFQHGTETIYVHLAALRNLYSLSVRNTEFDVSALQMVVDEMRCLTQLNMSECPHITDLAPLRNNRNIKQLLIYNTPAVSKAASSDVLLTMSSLTHLDISRDPSLQEPEGDRFPIEKFLESADALSRLCFLDISVQSISLTNGHEHLRNVIETHRQLQFLGLLNTHGSYYAENFRQTNVVPQLSHMTVTGDASMAQLLAALTAYPSRPRYVQHSLCVLYEKTVQMEAPSQEMLEALLPSVENCISSQEVCTAATACFNNLMKPHLAQKTLHKYLQKMVSLTIDSMQKHSNQQLHKNALLTLCNDYILHKVNFDYLRCGVAVIDSLLQNKSTIHVRKMCVAILSIIASQMTVAQTTELMQEPETWTTLLMDVKEKATRQPGSVTLRFILSALWNLTDESPKNCTHFINAGGLPLYLEILQFNREQGKLPQTQADDMETKLLGLCNNIAEVSTLREQLMSEPMLIELVTRLQCKRLERQYFAAGIISNLLCHDSWASSYKRELLVEQLDTEVQSFINPVSELVAYRSFRPFVPLLQAQTPAVRHWAIWALWLVTSKNIDKYVKLLRDSGISAILPTLVVPPDPFFQKYADHILALPLDT